MLPNEGQTPGFPCPRCGELIPVTVHQLLARDRFFCMRCGLELVLNAQQSRGAIDQIAQLSDEGKLPPK